MVRKRYPAAIKMPVVLVGARLAIKGEAVSDERGDEFAGGETAESPVVDRHEWLDRDSDLWLLRDADLADGTFGHRIPVLNKAFENHADDVLKVLDGFLAGVAPG
jgi:hypothetical protein